MLRQIARLIFAALCVALIAMTFILDRTTEIAAMFHGR
jgi:hypothetical protein